MLRPAAVCSYCLDDEFAVAVEELTIHPYFPALPQIAHHVPVNGGLVLGARLGIACPQRHMEATPDFLIEEYLAGELLYTLVGANGEFAQIARTFICIECFEQVVFVLLGAGVDHLAALEPQPDAGDFVSGLYGGIRKINVPAPQGR